ncbi:dephospho-CoA kinase [Bacillus fonticola]|uniref:dephospho-CoA kinase n=1 Tax=Bacillus fonticola TaxID=2728853 RepID=UPI001473A3A1|nr:dephospho-CoA kinase [Bacillus fonticola]
MKRIGITGGIATGKSTVSRMLVEKGFPVIDADVVARQVVEKGEPAMQCVADTFGEGVLHPDGTLNREALGSIVFHDKEKRNQLNAIVHPAVRKRMAQLEETHRKAGEPVVFLDIPLLFESKLTHRVEEILVVYVDEATQRERLKTRNSLTDKEAMARIRSQMSIEEKKEQADVVLDNCGTKAALQKALEAWLQQQGWM